TALCSVAGVDPINLNLGLVADAQRGGGEQLSADAKSQFPAAGRHRVRGELRAIQGAPDAHLPQATQDCRHGGGEGHYCETRRLFRPEEPDGPMELCTISHADHLLASSNSPPIDMRSTGRTRIRAGGSSHKPESPDH